MRERERERVCVCVCVCVTERRVSVYSENRYYLPTIDLAHITLGANVAAALQLLQGPHHVSRGEGEKEGERRIYSSLTVNQTHTSFSLSLSLSLSFSFSLLGPDGGLSAVRLGTKVPQHRP